MKIFQPKTKLVYLPKIRRRPKKSVFTQIQSGFWPKIRCRPKKGLHLNLVQFLAKKKVFAHRFCAQTFCPSYKGGGGGACRNFAYYSMLIILSWQPKGGAMAQWPPLKTLLIAIPLPQSLAHLSHSFCNL